MKTQEKDTSVMPEPSPAKGISAQESRSSLHVLSLAWMFSGATPALLAQQAVTKMDQVLVFPVGCAQQSCVLQSPRIHTFHLPSPPLPLLSSRLQTGLQCHSCHPRPVAGRPPLLRPPLLCRSDCLPAAPCARRARGGAARRRETARRTRAGRAGGAASWLSS